jgi:hypothetical protein
LMSSSASAARSCVPAAAYDRKDKAPHMVAHSHPLALVADHGG